MDKKKSLWWEISFILFCYSHFYKAWGHKPPSFYVKVTKNWHRVNIFPNISFTFTRSNKKEKQKERKRKKNTLQQCFVFVHYTHIKTKLKRTYCCLAATTLHKRKDFVNYFQNIIFHYVFSIATIWNSTLTHPKKTPSGSIIHSIKSLNIFSDSQYESLFKNTHNAIWYFFSLSLANFRKHR